MKCYALKDRKAKIACKSVLDNFLTFGIPLKLYSDQDPAYESELFQLLMKELGLKKLRTSGYRPQANGLTEQSNNTIKQYLTSYIEDSKDWDLWMKELAYS